MRPRPSKAALRQKRSAMREKLAEHTERRRQTLRARQQRSLERAKRHRRKGRSPSKPRNPWRWATAALLVLLCWRSCVEEPPDVTPAMPSAQAATTGPVGRTTEPLAVAPPHIIPATVERLDRPDYAVAKPVALPWLGSFRMQVAARGPRLAECFVGADAPGQLKWSGAVEPVAGRVSDHAFTPTSGSATLTRDQEECAVAVLSDPPFRLEAGPEPPSTPHRVSLILEF